jgi:hypothetical protein
MTSRAGHDREEPSERFDNVREGLIAEDPRVRRWAWIGLPAATVEGEVFAAVAYGELVVKLGQPRVERLVAEGAGEHFGAAEGRPFREWLLVHSGEADWDALTREARDFVAAGLNSPPPT